MKRYQTDAVNILAIVAGVSVILLLVTGFTLKYVYGQNADLIKKNGELVGQVKTVTDQNTALNKQLELKSKLTETASKQSEVHEKVIVEIKKETVVQTRKLPKPVVKEKDTKPTVEQNDNTAKRLDVLWVAYCSQEDSELCKTELNTETGKV